MGGIRATSAELMVRDREWNQCVFPRRACDKRSCLAVWVFGADRGVPVEGGSRRVQVTALVY